MMLEYGLSELAHELDHRFPIAYSDRSVAIYSTQPATVGVLRIGASNSILASSTAFSISFWRFRNPFRASIGVVAGKSCQSRLGGFVRCLKMNRSPLSVPTKTLPSA